MLTKTISGLGLAEKSYQTETENVKLNIRDPFFMPL